MFVFRFLFCCFASAFARCFSSEGKYVTIDVFVHLFEQSRLLLSSPFSLFRTVMQVQTETHAWIANNLKSSGSRDDFDKMAAANHINFAQVVEEDIKRALFLL
jgi:hypothetical protein